MKICTKCKVELHIEQFHADRYTKDGRKGECRDCVSERQHQNREKRREYERQRRSNPEKHKYRPRAVDSEGRELCSRCVVHPRCHYGAYCRSCANQVAKEWWEKNPDKRYKHKPVKKVKRVLTEEQRRRKNERRRRYHKERMQTDIQYRLQKRCRTRLDALKQTAGTKTDALIGCSWAELEHYLESKFTSGMSWENMGEWHIDHIRPLASFDLTDPEQLKQACHYINLQPMWAIDNYAKGARTA